MRNNKPLSTLLANIFIAASAAVAAAARRIL